MEFAVSENILAGNVITRRHAYIFGSLLPRNAMREDGAGLGKAISGRTVTLIKATDIVTADHEEMNIDGVIFEFMNTPYCYTITICKCLRQQAQG